MDSLFTRYGNPFVLLDGYISTGNLVGFIEEFINQKNESLEWEYYIHKLGAWDERTFDQFKRDIHNENVEKIERPSDEELETTIAKSFDILRNFNVEEGGEN